MKNLSLGSKLHIPSPSNPSCSTSHPPLFLKPIKLVISCGKTLKHSPSNVRQHTTPTRSITLKHTTGVEHDAPRSLVKHVVPDQKGYSRIVIMGAAVSVGVLLILSDQKAFALGPEGPLVEEFWDNVRRYALYALTVSTGAIYTIVQPIFELLKNPISAFLIIAILGGSIYIVSQVLSAMVGVSEFAYDYGY
ncbi:uncharacterized protein LOC133286392 [Gastrolobium bilobum]|uniref:uncharacterized protein LOC133286392 n=1 Tax=Gastrolobium bilobum TaxID=150636 RepID=UPI002AB1A231|nr:uncharacterized protein LOC133286392 [Gastrolobium bilobum]